MNNIIEYKGYFTKIEFDTEDMKLHGIIEGISDFVNFIADDPSSVETEFRAAVDDYLAFCETVGKSPDKSYKGSFNVRISPERHRLLAIKANKKGISLNAAVDEAISVYLNDEQLRIKTEIANLTEQYISSANFIKDSGAVNRTSNLIPFPELKYVYNEG